MNHEATDIKKQRDWIENIFNKMDIDIFISDLETDKIIFMNKKMLDEYGFDQSVIGTPCRKVFQINGGKRNIDTVVDWPGYGKAHMQQSTDINKHNRAKEALNLLNRSAIVLLSHNDESFAEAMTEGIDLIADIANINRLSVFRNSETPDGLLVSQIYRWSKSSGGTTNTRERLKNITYDDLAPDWQEILASGEFINGPISQTLKSGALTEFDCRTVLAMPVISGDTFWGFIYFEDINEDRQFTQFEIDMLRSACLMLANVVMRNEEVKKIHIVDEYAKLMLNATPLCCVLWDRSLTALDCNDAAIKLFGFKSKEECLENFDKCFPDLQTGHKYSLEGKKRLIKKAFSKDRQVVEWIHQTLNGTLIPSEVTLVRIKYGDDYLIAAYTRDLREEKRMNALLHAINRMSVILLQADSESFGASLLKAMKVMAGSAEVDRVYLWKNYAKDDGRLYCTQIYEWSEKAEPQDGKRFTAETCYDEEIPDWEYRLSRGRSINNLVKNMPEHQIKVLGKQNTVSLLVVPVILKGRFWGFLGFDNCRSERLFTENEENVLRSASELIADALIRNEMEENLRLTASKLQTALAEAQNANLAKSEFLSHMSHEMRTPMNAIIGMTSIGRSSQTIDKKDYAFDKIDNASNHLLGVINDILDMSKIEANKLELSSSEFIFDRMLQRVVNVINFRIDEKQQSMYVNISKSIPASLIGDDQRLSQVITNLLSNAVKFTPVSGSIYLNAEILSEIDGVCLLKINVTDTGIGLTEEQKKRIFKSFEQAETGTSRKYGGTGLGLAISKRIVELMGGEIWVESEEGRGASFSFTALLKRGAKVINNSLTEGADYSEIKILAVDDDPNIREFFTDTAADFNFACVTAASGEEALELLEKDSCYDVYFIDWKLPGMNGVELAKQIHRKKTEDSVILLFSAVDWSFISDEAKAAGINRFLSKPLFRSDIADVINEVLGFKNTRDIDSVEFSYDNFFGRTVLLAEDLEINREIVITLMEPTNLSIICAEDGLQAYNIFKESPGKFDLVLMDIQMPVMDGYDATRNIRGLDITEAKNVPIVAMTANVFREDIERCLNAGMNAHVGKPIIIDELLTVLKKYLG